MCFQRDKNISFSLPAGRVSSGAERVFIELLVKCKQTFKKAVFPHNVTVLFANFYFAFNSRSFLACDRNL